MKIAILNIFYYPFLSGGTEVFVRLLAEQFAKEHNVHVITSSDGTDSTEVINGVTVHRIKMRKQCSIKMVNYAVRVYNPFCKKQLFRVLRGMKPDVLHTNNLYAFSPVVWQIAHRLGIPIVHTVHDYTLMYFYMRFRVPLMRRFGSYVSVVTAPSNFTLEKVSVSKLFPEYVRKTVVLNAMRVDEVRLAHIIAKKSERDDERIKFAYIGRFAEEKGIDLLISSFSERTDDSTFHLFGKGSLNEESKKIISVNNRIHVHGFLEQEDLYRELESVDVVIVPSLWDEPFGLVVLDAYANACPVITTGRGGLREIVTDGETGRIISEETTESLNKAIDEFTDREKIRDCFPYITKAVRKYSIEKQVLRFEKLYREITAQ